MNLLERHRNSVMGLGVIWDKLEVSFIKAPSCAGFPYRRHLARGPRPRGPRVGGPRG